MPDRNRMDPLLGYNFRVEIEGVTAAAFREVGGLTCEVDPVEYREGDEGRLHVRKLYGLRKFTNISLKRGITTDAQLYAWYAAILQGGAGLRDGAIVMMDEVRADRLRWRFVNGFITKWEGPTMNATTSEVGVEMIEIAVDRVEMSVVNR